MLFLQSRIATKLRLWILILCFNKWYLSWCIYIYHIQIMFQYFSTSFRDNSVFSGLSVFPWIASCAAFTSISTPRSLVIMIVLVGEGPIVDSTWSIFGSPHNKYNIIIQILLVMGLLSSYHIQYHRISYTLSTTTWWFPKIGVPQNGDFEICVAPQRSAPRISQNVLRVKNGVQFSLIPPVSAPTALASLLSEPPH